MWQLIQLEGATLKGLCAIYEATHFHVYIRNNVMRNYGNNYTEIRTLYPNGGI